MSIAADPTPPDLETAQLSSAAATEALARTLALDETRTSAKTYTALLFTIDLVLLCLSAVIVVGSADAPPAGSWALWLFPPVALSVLGLRGVYHVRLRVSAVEDAGRVVASTGLAAMGVLALSALVNEPTGRLSGSTTLQVWLAATALVTLAHALLAGLRRTDVAINPGTRILIVGAGDVAGRIERRLRGYAEGIKVVGYLDVAYDDPDAPRMDELPDLTSVLALRRVVSDTGADHAIFAFGAFPDRALVPLVRECHKVGIRVSIVPRLFEAMSANISVEHLGGLPLVRLRHVNPKGWQFAVKHAVDRVTAAMVLLVLAPVLLAVAVAVKLSSPGPVFYRQRRIGRDGRSFVMLKFRSMRVAPAGPPALSPDERERADLAPGGVEGDDRRTLVGVLLRKTSLDELPQLINVLRGDMSLVGPRPERPEFVERFGIAVPGYGDRHRVKSGITGWAQVCNLRGQTSLSDRVEWDNYYIENWSLLLDLKIMLLTLPAMLRSVE